MQSCLLESSEQMKLGKGDRDSISTEITTAVAAAVDLLKPRGWRKALYVLRELGILGTIMTVIVALLGITAAAVYHAVADVREETQFRTNTGIRLTHIEETLKLIPAQIAASSFSNLPQKELQNHRNELNEIKKKLAATPVRDTPNFWPTSFQVITLLSKADFDIEPSTKPQMTLADIDGITPRILAMPRGTRILLQGSIRNSVFSEAIVTFDPGVRLQNVTFINCVLIFPTEQNPSLPLQKIGDVLLTSDLSRVTINAS